MPSVATRAASPCDAPNVAWFSSRHASAMATGAPGAFADAACTAMLSDADDAPRLSYATAANVYSPAADAVKLIVYGAALASPIFVAPWKNSTRTTEPSASDAVAVSVMLAGTVTCVADAASFTTGATLPP